MQHIGNFRPRRIGVLFYGEWRTADYCWPWNAQMCDRATKVFISTKIQSSFPNVKGDTAVIQHDPESLKFLARQYVPDCDIDVSADAAERLANSKGYWVYARLMWSMNRAFWLYQQWAKHNPPLDFLILTRLDELVGPHPQALIDWILSDDKNVYHVYSNISNMRFYQQEFGLGIGDLLLAGSPFAINGLLSYCMKTLTVEHEAGWTRWRHGPNIMLNDAAHESSLSVGHVPLPVALVRPNADLSIPVMDSFHYHEKFWLSNHKGTE